MQVLGSTPLKPSLRKRAGCTHVYAPAFLTCKLSKRRLVPVRSARPEHLQCRARAQRTSAEAITVEAAPCTSVAQQTDQTTVGPFSRLVHFAKKGLVLGAIIAAAVCLSAAPALAARSGGRMGGSGFGVARSSGFGASSSSMGGLSGSSFGSSRTSTMSRGPPLRVGFNSFVPVFAGGAYGGGGGGIGGVLIWVVGAAILFGVVTSFLDNRTSSAGLLDSAGGDRVSVIKLQVGLLGTARGMQRDLERIANRADTSGPSGLHYVLQETVLALLRNPDQCVYGSATVNSERSLNAGEDAFNRASMEERGKVKEETLVNYGGRSRQGASASSSRSNGVQELIVVTVLVAVNGGLKMPRVTSGEELKTALNRLGAVRSEQTLAVEVLWTPQDEQDYYSRDEVFADFPTLNNL